MVITHVKNGSPDMILTTFDGKIHEKKDELPPDVCRPSRKLKKNNVQQVDHQKVEKKQCRKKGSNKVEKTMLKKWVHIPLYTFIIPSYSFIYLQIALYTFIYPHIHLNEVPGVPPWPEFGMYLITLPPKFCLSPRDPNFN